MTVVHIVRVASQPGPQDQWAHIASCECGWREVRASRSDAADLALEHGAQAGGIDWPTKKDQAA
jgi:hypothetical protein